MKKYFFSFVLISILVFASGCAKVQMVDTIADTQAKQFVTPSKNESILYIYRKLALGAALKKDIWIDGKYIGETAPKTFFVESVNPGEHLLSTESEFSPNHILITTEGGKSYYIKQYIKPGIFVGGANFEVVPEEKGQKEITSSCNLAQPQTGNKPDLENVQSIIEEMKKKKN